MGQYKEAQSENLLDRQKLMSDRWKRWWYLPLQIISSALNNHFYHNSFLFICEITKKDNYSKKMRISNQLHTTNHELGVYCRNYVEFQSNSDFLRQTIPCFKLFELQLIIMQISLYKRGSLPTRFCHVFWGT